MLILRRFESGYVLNSRLFASATTVDSREIERFGKMTSEWWNEFGPTKGLHSMNRLRVPFIRDGLMNEGVADKDNIDTATPLTGLSILDVGCGGGILSEALARLGASVTGIDANSSVIDLAKGHAGRNDLSINYSFTSIEDHSIDNCEKYDAIAASEIIEHVSEKETFIAACAKCLKPNGSIFITTLNKTLLTNILGIYLVENLTVLVPKGTHQIEKCIEPHKLQRMLEDYNLQTKLLHGMSYNVFTNNWHWYSDTSMNYALHAVKIADSL